MQSPGILCRRKKVGVPPICSPVHMAPSERRTAALRLLAKIDQLIAECEDIASQALLADDEMDCVANHLQMRRDARKRVEELLKRFRTR